MSGESNTEKAKTFADSTNGVTLSVKEATSLPVEADSISPDLFVDRTNSEIKNLNLFCGRREVTIGDLFTVEGEASDMITLKGSLRNYKKIGRNMTRGRITVTGDVGMHLGAYMRGGEIIVHGSAHDWAGAHMQGGIIRIKRNGGHFVGAGYPGEKRGANRGAILIEGNAGNETGARMRRGLIVVMGDTGEFTGANLIAGSIFVFGRLGERAGAGNKRGSIVAMGDTAPLLPTYHYQCRFQPVYLRFYLRRIRSWGLRVSDGEIDGYFRRFSGDITTLGKGEIVIHD